MKLRQFTTAAFEVRDGQSLSAVCRTDDTEVTTFTDGCDGLRSILVDAGITTPPFLDWFHIAMRIQHAAQTAGGLPTDNPGRMQAKSVIVEEVERLRRRSTIISKASVVGLPIMPSGTVPAYVSELRSPKALPTSSSIGE